MLLIACNALAESANTILLMASTTAISNYYRKFGFETSEYGDEDSDVELKKEKYAALEKMIVARANQKVAPSLTKYSITASTNTSTSTNTNAIDSNEKAKEKEKEKEKLLTPESQQLRK